MNDEMFINACRGDDVETVDRMVRDGYPMYIFLKSVFRMIYEYDAVKLFDYTVSYIEEHPLNKFDVEIVYSSLIKQRKSNILYYLFGGWISEYRLFSLIRDNKFDDLKLMLDAEIEMIYIDATLIKKLTMINISDEILSLLRDQIIKFSWLGTDVGINKYSILACYLSTELDVYHMIATLDDSIKLTFLHEMHLLEGRKMLHQIIKNGAIELVGLVKKKYNMEISITDYAAACYAGRYQFALSILSSYIFNKSNKKYKLDNDSLESDKLVNCIRTHIKKDILMAAHRNSILSGNRQLIEFNERLIRKCYKVVDVKADFDIDELVENLGYEYKIDRIRNIYAQMINICDRGANIYSGIRSDFVYVYIYYLCSNGMKQYFVIDGVESRTEIKIMTSMIMKHFEDLNEPIRENVLGSEILNKNVLGLVYQYAKY